MAFSCPTCHKDFGLWESVTVQGWRSVDSALMPSGDRDIDWGTAERDGWAHPEMGCSECEWTGPRGALVTLGIDGEPLPFVHPNQTQIEVA